MQSSEARTPNTSAGREALSPTCRACSAVNDAAAGTCRNCGALLDRAPDLLARDAEIVRRRAYEARIGEAESQLDALSRRIHAVEAERAAIAAALATVRRRTLGATSLRADRAAPIVDAGPFRAIIGGVHGSRVERSGDDGAPPALAREPWPLLAEPAAPDHAASELEHDLWEAFANGSTVVRIACEPGGGASTLLRRLAAGAASHGFVDGGLVLAEVRGPVMDVAQRLARRVFGALPARHRRAEELRAAFAGRAVFVGLDRAALTDAELQDLTALLPGVRFALVDTLTRAAAPAFTLTFSDAERLVTLLESGYRGRIDGAERIAARELCATIAAWPGRARLIGVAAAEMQRSFRSLRTEYVSGNAVVHALIARQPALERRILDIAASARMPLPAPVFAAILDHERIDTALERLTTCELLTPSGAADFELPRSVRALLPRALDADALTGRIIDALCDAFDPWSNVEVSDEQAGAAEALLGHALERGDAGRVLALGPRLAEIFAERALFGAWERVLVLVGSAAERTANAGLQAWARHELGVSALLLSRADDARLLLETASRERARAGDGAGAAASGAVLALLDPRLATAAEPGAAVARRRSEPGPAAASPALVDIGAPAVPPPPPPAPALAAARAALTGSAAAAATALERVSPRIKLFALGALAIASFVVIVIGLWPRAAAGPTIADFSTDTPVIAAGTSAQLCVQAVGAATLDITPRVAIVPSDAGRQCATVSPTVTTTYTAVATGADGQQDRSSVTLTVHPTPAPRPLAIDAFSAEPARIVAGGTTRLCYAVSGANLLRIIPRVGNLVRLNACQAVTLTEPHGYTYRLLAIGEGGQIAVRSVRVDVRPAPAPHQPRSGSVAAAPTPIDTPAASATPRPRRERRLAAADATPARRAIYQFDVTPQRVDRGQTASLCVGVGHWARGDVTTIGALTPGITRCYRVRPLVTTTYRLNVALDRSTAFETLTVEVRAPARPHIVARAPRR